VGVKAEFAEGKKGTYLKRVKNRKIVNSAE
jgi:hypothetical protein